MNENVRPVKKVKREHEGLHCDECNTFIPNEASLHAHLQGKKHLKNIERINSLKATAERSLYVSGIGSCSSAELEIADYFSKFGPISKITVDKNAGRYALLEFSKVSSARNALLVEDHKLRDVAITVKPREVKVPNLKREPTQNRITHNQCPPEVWKALMDAYDVENQFQVLENVVALSTDEIHLRELICEFLHSAFVEVFPSCRIQPFGSSVNQFGVHSCDLDLNFQYESVDTNAVKQFVEERGERNGIDGQSSESLTEKEVLSLLANIIKHCIPDCHKVKAILSARRPVVKFSHKASGLSCDISVGNELAVRNTYYLQLCCKRDHLLLPLVLTVRLWMKHWNLAGSAQAASPLLNNYAVTLLVFFYLHNCKRLSTLETQRASDALTPCIIENWDCSFSEDISKHRPPSNSQSLPVLLSGFFSFYAKLDFSKFVLCLTSGNLLEISELKLKAGVESCDHTDSRTKSFKYGSLNIQDPFELNHNVAGNVGNKHMMAVTKCLRNATLSCEMKIYSKKPIGFIGEGLYTKIEPWGILNLFVDHHSKKQKRMECTGQTTSSFQLSKDSSYKGSDWASNAVSLTLTVLSKVFLMRISGQDITNEDCMQDSGDCEQCLSVKVNSTQAGELDLDDDSPQKSNRESRKRSLSTSPVYQKRSKIALNSPEASALKQRALMVSSTSDFSFPYLLQCEATHPLWEGRRKARRQLVQPGVGDILELEQKVSQLLASESKSDSQTSASTSSAGDGGSCSHNFSFDLRFEKSDEDSLNLEFSLHPEYFHNQKQFQHFFHHFELFLPKIMRKCNRTQLAAATRL